MARSLFKAALAVVAAAWALWLVAVHVFLWTPLLRRIINAERPSIGISYSFAWSLIPGHVHVRDLVLIGQDHGIQWRLELARVETTIQLDQLPRKIFHAKHVRADGISWRMRRRLPASELDDETVAQLPQIEGFSRRPLEEEGPDDDAPDWRYGNFSVWLEDIQGGGLRELWVDRVRATGRGSLSGAFYLKPMRELYVAPAHITWDEVHVTQGDDELASGALSLTTRVGPLDPRKLPAADYFRRMDLELFANLRALGGVSKAELHVQAGQVLAGTHAEVDARSLRFDKLRVEHAVAQLAVTPPNDARLVVAAEGVKGFGASGSARVTLEGPAPDLGALALPKHASVEARGRLDPALMAKAFDAPLAVHHGAGDFEAHLEGPPQRLAGRLYVQLQRLEVERSGVDVEADASADVHVAALDPLKGADLRGTRVSVGNARVVGGHDAEPGWWARATLPRAQIRFDTGELDADLAARCRDARPIVGLYVQRADLPGFVSGLFAMDDLAVTGSARVGRDFAALRDLDARGEGASVRASWRHEQGASQGAALLTWRGLSVGVGMGDGGSHVQVLGAGSWFAAEEARLGPAPALGPLPRARAPKPRRRPIPVQTAE